MALHIQSRSFINTIMVLTMGGLLTTAFMETAQAQENAVTIGYAWQDDTDQTLYQSHYGLDEGLFLDALQLNLHQKMKSFDRFKFDARGFGAEPYQSAKLDIRRNQWLIKLDYNRRTFQFTDTEFEAGLHRNDWALSRWRGDVSYRGFKKLDLNLIARHTQRKGWSVNPFFGLGVPFVKGRTFDDRMSEYGIGISSKKTPVWFLLEQTFTRYKRSSQFHVENDGQGVLDVEPTLSEVGTPSQDQFTTPTTRLMAAFSGKRLQWHLQGLFRQDDLDVERDDVNIYQVMTGSFEQRDIIQGNGDRDTSMASARLGFAASPSLILRLDTTYRDRSYLSNITGEERVVLTGPLSSETISQDVMDLGVVDQQDTRTELGMTWKAKATRINLSYRFSERSVTWQPNLEAARLDVDRETDGIRATINHTFKKTRAQLGWENDSFSNFIYRTDPEAVDRTWLRLRAKVNRTLSFNVNASQESGDNPTDRSNLDRSLTLMGVNAILQTKNKGMIQLGVRFLDQESDIETLIYAPDAQTVVSNYDSQWRQFTLQLMLPVNDRFRITGQGAHNTDSGDTFPLTSWNGSLRMVYRGAAQFDYGLLLQHHSYDPETDSVNTYDVDRISVTIGRRF